MNNDAPPERCRHHFINLKAHVRILTHESGFGAFAHVAVDVVAIEEVRNWHKGHFIVNGAGNPAKPLIGQQIIYHFIGKVLQQKGTDLVACLGVVLQG
jgi:hypothetical protein